MIAVGVLRGEPLRSSKPRILLEDNYGPYDVIELCDDKNRP